MPTTEVEAPRGHARVTENGRILIPAAVREQMGIKPGESVVWRLQDGVLHIESYLATIRRIQEELKPLRNPDRLASDELIAERREEARRELAEAGLE